MSRLLEEAKPLIRSMEPLAMPRTSVHAASPNVNSRSVPSAM